MTVRNLNNTVVPGGKTEAFFEKAVKHGENGKEYSLSETSVRRGEAIQLRRLVTESEASKTLEIGLALGGSAIAITEALSQQRDAPPRTHVVLDPYQRDFGNVGLRELQRLGLMEYVEFLPVFAEDFLYESSKQRRSFDFIFNDGGHSIGTKMTNTFFADHCLREGGILAFHDAFSKSVAACVKYLVIERNYEVITLPPDSFLKRVMRTLKYGFIHGPWYALHVVTRTSGSLVALRKTQP